MKREASFTTAFRAWAKTRPSAAWEIKHTRGRDRFQMRELKQHQIDALLAVKGPYGFAYKIPDDGVAYKPFDLFVLRKTAAWVVICYPKYFCVIDAAKIARLKDKKASLTFDEAMALSSFTVRLKDLLWPAALRGHKDVL